MTATPTDYRAFLERKLHAGETVLTPFMGVGSEVYGAVMAGRRGIGMELKPSYYRQAVRNLELAGSVESNTEQSELFAEAVA